MKVRTIYVHPDDILRIRFVHDGARPTKYEWQARPRAGYDELVLQDLKPYSFTLSPQGLVKVAGATHPGVDAGKLAALESDAARMDWIQKNLLCADWEYPQGEKKTQPVICISWPASVGISGNLRSSIDDAMKGGA